MSKIKALEKQLARAEEGSQEALKIEQRLDHLRRVETYAPDMRERRPQNPRTTSEFSRAFVQIAKGKLAPALFEDIAKEAETHV